MGFGLWTVWMLLTGSPENWLQRLIMWVTVDVFLLICLRLASKLWPHKVQFEVFMSKDVSTGNFFGKEEDDGTNDSVS